MSESGERAQKDLKMNSITETPRIDRAEKMADSIADFAEMTRPLEKELAAKDAEIARLITITKEQDLTARLLVEENQRLTATNVQREARERK